MGEDQDDKEDRSAPDQHRLREGVTHAVEMLSEEHEFNELYQSHVEAGRCLVGISVSRSIQRKQRRTFCTGTAPISSTTTAASWLKSSKPDADSQILW